MKCKILSSSPRSGKGTRTACKVQLCLSKHLLSFLIYSFPHRRTCYRAKAARILLLKLVPLPSHLLRAYFQYLPRSHMGSIGIHAASNAAPMAEHWVKSKSCPKVEKTYSRTNKTN